MLSDAARAQLQAEVERQQRDIQRFTEDAQQEVQALQQQLQEEFTRKLKPVIEKVAQEKQVHMVFNATESGLVWADPGLDLTADVIKALDTAAPAAGARSAATAPSPPPPRPSSAARVRDVHRRRRPLSAPGRACPVLVDARDRAETPLRLPISTALLGAPLLPLSRLASSTRSSSTSRAAGWWPFKNVTVNEEFFQGHFPALPLMPAVLMIEALTQAAAVLVLDRSRRSPAARVALRGVNSAKFRAAGRARRPAAARGHAAAAPRSRLAKVAGRGLSSAIRRRRRGRRCCWRSIPAPACDRIRRPSCIPAPASARGTIIGPALRRSAPT